MNLIDVASERFDVHPIVIIAYSFMYYEIPVDKQTAFKFWTHYVKTKESYELVEDYSLELLSGRTKLPKLNKAQRRPQNVHLS
jgi:hypothetical protein